MDNMVSPLAPLLCDLENEIINNINKYIPNYKGCIYHYTSPYGINGIIENCTLRFTDRNYLNDYSEGIYVLDLCIDYVEEISENEDCFQKCFIKKCQERKNNLHPDGFYVYQCSFSKDRDNLGLWNYYTKGDSILGYNLCFDAEESIISPQVRCIEAGTPPIFKGEIVYTKKKQINILKKVYKEFWDLYARFQPNNYSRIIVSKLVDIVMLLGIFFKKECFQLEKEFRIAMDLHRKESKDIFSAIYDKQNFFVKNGILIPYVDIKFKQDSLKGICVSPTVDFDTAKRSLMRALAKNFTRLNENSIQKSSIPVRY